MDAIFADEKKDDFIKCLRAAIAAERRRRAGGREVLTRDKVVNIFRDDLLAATENFGDLRLRGRGGPALLSNVCA